MKTNSWTFTFAAIGLIALAVSLRPATTFAAQQSGMQMQSTQKPAMESAMGHSHEMAELHGGSVTMTPANHFELLCTPKEARLYVYDAKQVPITNLDGMKASMMLQEKTGKPMTMSMTYVKPDAAKGHAQGYFVAAHDFSVADKMAMKATFTIEGLAKAPIEFKSAIALGEPTVYACPMHPDVTGEDPGKCSKCGMNLVKVGGDEDHGTKAGGTSGHDH